MALPKGLALQKRLFNKKYVVPTRPKRWTRDPVVKKKYYKHKKRKKPKKHVVKSHTRGGQLLGGMLPHGSHYIGGTFGNDSQQVFRGQRNTYYSTRMKPSKRRRADFQGRLAMKSGRVIG